MPCIKDFLSLLRFTHYYIYRARDEDGVLWCPDKWNEALLIVFCRVNAPMPRLCGCPEWQGN